MDITKEKLQKLNKLGLRLDHYLVLYSKANDLGLLPYYRVDNNIYMELIEKGYLTLSKNITKDGIQLVKTEEEDGEWREHFERWWDLYPISDKYAHFRRTRAVRGNKAAAERSYKRRFLSEGDSFASKALRGLQSQIERIKMESNASGSNKFTFLPNASKWLNNDTYEVWNDAGGSRPKSGKSRIRIS